jgi:Uma2 family endonuclease
MSAHSIPHFTVEQYLEMDEAAEYPLEYHDGEIFPLAEASYAHGALLARICAVLTNGIQGRSCTVLSYNLRVLAAKSYVHPDVAVVCGQPLFTDKWETISNPVLIVETLSKSTEGYDRGAKFDFYRSLESLQEYVLVASKEPRILVFTRDPEGAWIFRDFGGMDAVCHLSSLDCSLPLAQVYENVPFTGPGSDQAFNE